jgi:hypothetical protein
MSTKGPPPPPPRLKLSKPADDEDGPVRLDFALIGAAAIIAVGLVVLGVALCVAAVILDK